jgi:hypothetical protein
MGLLATNNGAHPDLVQPGRPATPRADPPPPGRLAADADQIRRLRELRAIVLDLRAVLSGIRAGAADLKRGRPISSRRSNTSPRP